MDIAELRLGNLIRISPRPNEEGILFLSEIQASSIIGTMVSPRQGYQFRIKFNEMLPLNITETWLTELEFNKTNDATVWVDKENIISVRLAAGSYTIANETSTIEIKYMHQLQNEYYKRSGKELLVKLLVD